MTTMPWQQFLDEFRQPVHWIESTSGKDTLPCFLVTIALMKNLFYEMHEICLGESRWESVLRDSTLYLRSLFLK
jgi:hypothetical protein